MARKGENIFHRKDGRWEARYVKGYKLDGKCQYGYLYGKTYQEVKTKRIQYLLNADIQKKKKSKVNVLFRDKAELWLNKQKFSVKLSTYSYYMSVVYNHLLPELGNLLLNDIDEEVIYSFINQKILSHKLKKSTLHEIVGILKQILQFSNIYIKIRLPKLDKKEIKTLSKEQKEILETYISDHLNDITIGILLSLYTGLRLGEVCALKWQDIDFNLGVVTVKKTVSRVKNLDKEISSKTKLILTSAKTENSIRIIPINRSLLKLLKFYKMKYNKLDSNFILSSTNQFMDPRNYYNQFKKILKSCHLESFNYHSLRHTFATNCIKEGLDPKSLSEILGHSDIKITLAFYVHPNIESKKQFINQEDFCPIFLRQNSSHN